MISSELVIKDDTILELLAKLQKRTKILTVKQLEKSVLEAIKMVIPTGTKKNIMSPVRQFYIVTARHIYCFLMYQLSNMGVREIGVLIKRDYSTVIASRKRLSDLINTDKEVREILTDILAQLMIKYENR